MPEENSKENAAAIVAVVSTIAPGQVMSYGEVARRAGLPGYARYVAAVLKRLPDESQIPWHRVVNANQRIAFAEGSEGFARQYERLAAEGWQLQGNKLLAG